MSAVARRNQARWRGFLLNEGGLFWVCFSRMQSGQRVGFPATNRHPHLAFICAAMLVKDFLDDLRKYLEAELPKV